MNISSSSADLLNLRKIYKIFFYFIFMLKLNLPVKNFDLNPTGSTYFWDINQQTLKQYQIRQRKLSGVTLNLVIIYIITKYQITLVDLFTEPLLSN